MALPAQLSIYRGDIPCALLLEICAVAFRLAKLFEVTIEDIFTDDR